VSRTVPLNASGSVTLNGSGNGQVALGPSLPGTAWYPTGASVIVSSSGSVPTLKLYLGSVGQSNFIGGSYTGNNDTASVSAITLYPGQVIIAVWAGGDSGATATVVLTGTMTIPG
jgi:hypothetical protein